MSINVTVRGNPISIKHGKMVTVDSNSNKNEFHKRRRMRLEQVRQQSKDIAEKVRNKVRDEKTKQLSQIEEQGQKELKEWQARKLLALQQQYQECLNDIGLGHVQAALEEESEEIEALRNEHNTEVAKERGKKAAEKLQIDKNIESRKRAIPIQQKKLSKAIESTRSTLVSKLNQKQIGPFKRQKRPKISTDINISSNIINSTDSEEIPQLLNLSNGSLSTSSKCNNKRERVLSVSEEESNVNVEKSKRSVENMEEIYLKECHCGDEQYRNNSDVIEINKSRWNSPKRKQYFSTQPTLHERAGRNFPIETRISDHIKNRSIPSSKFSEDSNTYQDIPFYKVPKPTAYPQIKVVNNDRPQEAPVVKCKCNMTEPSKTVEKSKESRTHKQDSVKSQFQTLPDKPTISVRDHSDVKSSRRSFLAKVQPSEDNRVKYYNHTNRFSKEYVADSECVKKITDESIEVCPGSGSETEFIKRVYQRDKEAQERGHKAMEKERVHRDYRHMLHQLPLLQKQERIAGIYSHKPQFHMSQDRVKQSNIRKQNRLENAYEKLFPIKESVVTLPPKNHAKPDECLLPFKTVHVSSDSPPILNVGTWDVDAPRKINRNHLATLSSEASELLKLAAQSKSDSESDAAQKRNLNEMLEKLKEHRDHLMKETTTLPKDSNLYKLLHDLGELGFDKSTCTSTTNNEKSKAVSSTNISESSSEIDSVQIEKPSTSKKRSKHGKKAMEERTVEESAPKRTYSISQLKKRRDVLILQNTSTQTSPLSVKNTVEKIIESRIPNAPPPSPVKVVQNQQKSNDKDVVATKCDCDVGTKPKNDDKLCEIVIKITEDHQPKISVRPIETVQKQVKVKTKRERTEKSAVDSQSNERSNVKENDQVKSKAKEKNVKLLINDTGEQYSSKNKLFTSWKEYFSQNSSNGVSSSTSYFSPPDFKKSSGPSAESTRREETSCDNAKCKSLSFENTGTSRQKSKSDSTTKSTNNNTDKLDPQLLQHIKKLLSMSRGSIDDLGVSTVSDVSTPSSSVLRRDSNDPLNRIQNFIRQYNLSLSDIDQYLNYSSDSNNPHYNTAESLTVSSTDNSSIFNKFVEQRNKAAASKNKSPSTTQPSSSENGTSSSYISDKQNVTNTSEHSLQKYANVLSQYTELADNCNKRIENLTALIDKVRLERLKMLQCSNNSDSDKENSTAYLDLPPNLLKAKEAQNNSDYSPSSSSKLEQEELTKRLLEVDFNLVDNLKHKNDTGKNDNQQSKEFDSEIDSKLLERFKKLLEVEKRDSYPNDKTVNFVLPAESESKQKQPTQSEGDGNFIPFLMHIPILPKLEPYEGYTTKSNHSKPPLSKGITAAKRLNNNLVVVPHELSTIAEADSIQSIKAQRSGVIIEDITSSKESSPHKNISADKAPARKIPSPEAKTSDCVIQQDIGDSNSTVGKNKDQESSSDVSIPDIISELMQTVKDETDKAQASSNTKQITSPQQLDIYKTLVTSNECSDSSTSELDNIESMLKSLGMGWAVATLRKTQEALALTSSSSSLDLTIKHKEVKLTDSSTTSAVSLREVLGRQFLKKITSSTSTSDGSTASLSPLIKELQDISAIEGSGGTSHDKTNQRTSTPVPGSKSPSQIIADKTSSGSNKSEADNIHSIQYYSLNSTESTVDKNVT